MLDFPGPGGLTLGQVFTSAGKSWQWDGAKWGPAAGGGAPLDSPSFTGDPKAPTPSTGDNDSSIATTAFVKAQAYLTGNQSITLSGDITGAGTTAIAATLATVNANVGTFQGLTVDAKGRVTAAVNQGYAPLASPVFTGTPSLPTGTTGVTQTAGNSTTALATTAFVTVADALKANLASPVFTGDPQAPTPATADNDTSIATTAFVKAQGYVTGGPYLPLAGGNVTGNLVVASGSGTGNAEINLGRFRGADGPAYLDLYASNDDNFDLRLLRNPGVNGNSSLSAVGTGVFGVYTNGVPRAVFGDQPAGVDLTVTRGFASMGVQPRAGTAGAATSNLYNINWTGSAVLWIDTVNAGTITLTSDYRIKENVVDLPPMWDRVKSLRPVSYTLKDNAELLSAADPMEQWGFIAHELQETLIEAAATGYKDAPNLIQSPNVMVLLAPLTCALQEAMARIENLEARLPAAVG